MFATSTGDVHRRRRRLDDRRRRHFSSHPLLPPPAAPAIRGANQPLSLRSRFSSHQTFRFILAPSPSLIVVLTPPPPSPPTRSLRTTASAWCFPRLRSSQPSLRLGKRASCNRPAVFLRWCCCAYCMDAWHCRQWCLSAVAIQEASQG